MGASDFQLQYLGRQGVEFMDPKALVIIRHEGQFVPLGFVVLSEQAVSAHDGRYLVPGTGRWALRETIFEGSVENDFDTPDSFWLVPTQLDPLGVLEVGWLRNPQVRQVRGASFGLDNVFATVNLLLRLNLETETGGWPRRRGQDGL